MGPRLFRRGNTLALGYDRILNYRLQWGRVSSDAETFFDVVAYFGA